MNANKDIVMNESLAASKSPQSKTGDSFRKLARRTTIERIANQLDHFSPLLTNQEKVDNISTEDNLVSPKFGESKKTTEVNILWDGKSIRSLVEAAIESTRKDNLDKKQDILFTSLSQGRDSILLHARKKQKVFSRSLENSGQLIGDSVVFKRLPSANILPGVPSFSTTTESNQSLTSHLSSEIDEQQVSKEQLDKSSDDTKVEKSAILRRSARSEMQLQSVSKQYDDEYSTDAYKLNYKLRYCNSRSGCDTYLRMLVLHGAPLPRPLSSTTIFLRGLVFGRDEQTLTHVPYFGDDDEDAAEVLGLERGVSPQTRTTDISSDTDGVEFTLETKYSKKTKFRSLDSQVPLCGLRKSKHSTHDCASRSKNMASSSTYSKDNLSDEVHIGTGDPGGGGVWDMTHREKLLEVGAEHRQEEEGRLIQQVLHIVSENCEQILNEKTSSSLKITQERISESMEATQLSERKLSIMKEVTEIVAELMDVELERVADYWGDTTVNYIKSHQDFRNVGQTMGSFAKHDTTHCDRQTSKDNISLSCAGSKQKIAFNSSSGQALPYAQLMDSYRSLFCRRCFIYDCALHGNHSKADPELQGELAVEREKEGFWDKQFNDEGFWGRTIGDKPDSKLVAQGISKSTKSGNRMKRMCAKVSSHSATSSITPIQISVLERLNIVFQGDTEKMAKAMGADVSSVQTFVNELSTKILPVGKHLTEDYHRRKVKDANVYSMKHYNPSWLKRVEEAKINPLFYPCDHEGLCSDENCSCVRNAWFCTKHCVWSTKSRNFFRGCACKAGQCRTRSCSCYAALRECDPDLCRSCGACSDPPNARASKQMCRNDNVSMRRHAHLLMAESSIDGAGWGLYNKQALKKGDYIHEYVGEVISQEEAERRGRIYDKVNRSYLFNLTADFVVDASRKGNKTRFINHSAKPNCSTRLMLVNGTMRIGLFAKEDIEAQSEVRFLIDMICLQLNFSYQELIFAIRSFSTIAMMLA